MGGVQGTTVELNRIEAVARLLRPYGDWRSADEIRAEQEALLTREQLDNPGHQKYIDGVVAARVLKQRRFLKRAEMLIAAGEAPIGPLPQRHSVGIESTGTREPLEVFEVECRLCGAKPQMLCKTRAPFPKELEPDKSHKVRFVLAEARNVERGA